MEQFNNLIKCVFFLLSGVWGGASAVAGSASVEFSALIGYEGACEVSVPAEVNFNSNEPILPSQIEAHDAVTIQHFDLTLSGCQGVGLTPKIQVDGKKVGEAAAQLFLDDDSTSVGYGILLSTTGSAAFQANSNLASQSMILAVEDWDKFTRLNTINGTLPMTATLTCGECNTPDRVGGELKAGVTFDFMYD